MTLYKRMREAELAYPDMRMRINFIQRVEFWQRSSRGRTQRYLKNWGRGQLFLCLFFFTLCLQCRYRHRNLTL